MWASTCTLVPALQLLLVGLAEGAFWLRHLHTFANVHSKERNVRGGDMRQMNYPALLLILDL